MRALAIAILSATLVVPHARGVLSPEVGFLDLATAERSDEELGLVIVSLAGVTGLTPVPAFRLKLEPSGERTARRGESLEVVARLENITSETLAIPFETDWKRVLGEVPGDAVKEFPEGYMWAILRVWVEEGPDPDQRFSFPFDGILYGCLCRPETIRVLAPGQWVRIRALARVPEGIREGPGTFVVELSFAHGFNSARYRVNVLSEPASLQILPPSAAVEEP
jgi:hypothetical protein